MQKVNCLPVEAPLALSYKRWGLCNFMKSGNLEFMLPFVGGGSPTYRTNRLARLKASVVRKAPSLLDNLKTYPKRI